MSEFFQVLSTFFQTPAEHQGFVIGLAAIALAGYAIYAVLSVVRRR